MKQNEILDLDFKDNKNSFTLNRREFFKAAGTGIFILYSMWDVSIFAQEEPTRGRQGLPRDFNAFLKIGEDGKVTLFTGKIEMGQGVITSLAQELADEIDVSVDSIKMVMGDTELCPYDMGTFGSMTTRFFGPHLRAAGAEARLVLLELASEQLKIPVKDLETEDGIIYQKKNKKNKISYAQLAKGKKILRHISGPVKVKSPSEFKIIGKPENRNDAIEKVTGKAKYSADIQLPGMMYARILRPPAHGAKMLDVDISDARKVEGVEIIHEGDFVAVLHKYPDVAEDALQKIKARFEKPVTNIDDENIFEYLLKSSPEGEVVANEGNIKEGEKKSSAVIEETYYDGYKAHAPIEPHTAVVKIEGDKATVRASTQTPFGAKDEVARELNIPAGNVRVVPPFLGGGFGGKSRNQEILEAARLAKLSGQSVQVAWTREEEFFLDSFRPAAIVKIKSGFTKEGKIDLWDYNVYYAGERGAPAFYNIPNSKTTVYGSGWGGEKSPHPFATGAWRAPGNNTNTFARESQIDIMAAKAGIDPLEFRLQNLKDKTMIRVLQTAAKKFGWKPAKAPSGRGYGIACGIDAGTTVASFVEVAVDKNSGDVKVVRIVCAQDMGLSVNPEGAAIQMEGCVTMVMGYALKEDIHFKNGEIFDLNFDTYEIPRFSWLPKIETIIIDNKEAPPQGGGEPAIITMGGAIANAIYDAVGARVFQMPMTPDRVLKALQKD